MSSAPAFLDRHERARLAYERGDLRKAFAVTRECLTANKDDGRAWEILGLVHFASGNFRHSVSSLEHASLLVPLKPTGRACLGHGYARVGKTELAIDLMENLLSDASVPPSVLLQIGGCLNDLERPDLAMEACFSVLRVNDCYAQAYYELGYYAGQCDYALGMVEIFGKRAVELAPETPRYRVGLAGFLYRRERFEEAWQYVRNLSNADIASLSCTCCVERVIELYEMHQDYRRSILCRQRLIELEVDGHSDCS